MTEGDEASDRPCVSTTRAWLVFFTAPASSVTV
jgi:hypothetical protein